MTLPKSENSLEHKRDDDSEAFLEPVDEEDSERPTHRRLQSSRNFLVQDLNETFLPLDQMSVTSEDHNLLMDTQDVYGDSMGVVFPNMDAITPIGTQNSSTKIIKGQKEIPVGRVYHKNVDNLTNSSCANVFLSSQSQSSSAKMFGARNKNEPLESSRSYSSGRKKVHVIHRQGKYANDLERNSSYTIHL